MDKLTEKIYEELSNHRSIFLVGPTDSGKTWCVTHKLIPFFANKKFEVLYFSDCDKSFDVSNTTDAVIVDEAETLLDKTFLENQNTDKYYYSLEYLEKVRGWHGNLKKFSIPCVFVVTRNKKEEIDNLVNIVTKTDWGVPAKCFAFEGNSKPV